VGLFFRKAGVAPRWHNTGSKRGMFDRGLGNSSTVQGNSWWSLFDSFLNLGDRVTQAIMEKPNMALENLRALSDRRLAIGSAGSLTQLSCQKAEEIAINVERRAECRGARQCSRAVVDELNPARGYDRGRRIYSNLYFYFSETFDRNVRFRDNRDTLKINSMTVNDDHVNADFRVRRMQEQSWQISVADRTNRFSNQDTNHVFIGFRAAGKAL